MKPTAPRSAQALGAGAIAPRSSIGIRAIGKAESNNRSCADDAPSELAEGAAFFVHTTFELYGAFTAAAFKSVAPGAIPLSARAIPTVK
jgi:hypothetical protein